jgi:hypothetical protein
MSTSAMVVGLACRNSSMAAAEIATVRLATAGCRYSAICSGVAPANDASSPKRRAPSRSAGRARSTGSSAQVSNAPNRFHAVGHQVFGLPPQVGPNVAGVSLFTAEACAECAGYDVVGTQVTMMPAFARPAANGDESAANAETVKLFYFNGGLGQLWASDYVPQDGVATNLGGGCGNLTATASWSCAKVTATAFGATSTFEATLRNAPANAFLLLSTDRLDASGCGTCTVVLLRVGGVRLTHGEVSSAALAAIRSRSRTHGCRCS